MFEHKKTLTEYIEDLESDDPKTRLDAAMILGEWGNDWAVTPLIDALQHEDENFRRESARALKEIGNKRAVEPLIDVLMNDESLEVRAEAAYALGYFEETNDFIELLLPSLEDPHYLIRQNIAFALGKLDRKKSVSPLIDVLEKDENANVREMAAWALGELNNKRALDALISALDDESEGVRRNAAYALGRLGRNSSIEPLKKQLQRKGEIKESAWALTKILSKKQTINLLTDLFKKKKREKLADDCIEIVKLLIGFDRKQAKKFIEEMLSENDFKEYFDEIKSIV